MCYMLPLAKSLTHMLVIWLRCISTQVHRPHASYTQKISEALERCKVVWESKESTDGGTLTPEAIRQLQVCSAERYFDAVCAAGSLSKGLPDARWQMFQYLQLRGCST